MPLSRCSRGIVYINTSPADQRVRLAKTALQLQQLPPGSKDVFASGLLEHYVQRPRVLENICLADFASLFDFSKKCTSKIFVPALENDDEDAESLETVAHDGFLCWMSLDTSVVETNLRNEAAEITKTIVREKYESHRDCIERISNIYSAKQAQDVDRIIQEGIPREGDDEKHRTSGKRNQILKTSSKCSGLDMTKLIYSQMRQKMNRQPIKLSTFTSKAGLSSRIFPARTLPEC
ncbi:hypothetical protein JTE90_014227 [Oedothorax gibbosus]|uniref:Uncharacterized protein n=1 Tax=Oedothorax gibbosus TaxID=931172 RepID=A0AAV6TSN0_9ARAC|nr:hypothetical protein JTE90_014227 [Oedothorax gibbosus]